jgi:hypothetical protein
VKEVFLAATFILVVLGLIANREHHMQEIGENYIMRSFLTFTLHKKILG